MDLYKEILVSVLANENIHVTFPNLQIDTEKIVESTCYQALCKIKLILEDDSLDDEQCFMKIEEILCILEDIGSNGGIRHDFG